MLDEYQTMSCAPMRPRIMGNSYGLLICTAVAPMVRRYRAENFPEYPRKAV